MTKITAQSIADIFRFVILLSLLSILGTVATAQCFGSFANLSAAAASTKEAARPGPRNVRTTAAEGLATDKASTPTYSIVGLWQVHYSFPNMDQEAYQAFEAGGTEIHNPNTPTNGICLGAWDWADGNTFTLTHRVWLYDNGTFVGVGHLDATIELLDRGNVQTGRFTMTIYDLSGNAISPPIPGTLEGKRVTPK